MGRQSRYTTEQIVAKLREAEKLQAQGATIAQVCKQLGVSDQTFFRWRTKYGALKEDEAQRLKELENENTRLKRIVADQALDIDRLVTAWQALPGVEHVQFDAQWMRRLQSVLNSHNQVHGVPNVFVTDGAAMASAGNVNPSLTFMALTLRAVEYAVGQIKAGKL